MAVDIGQAVEEGGRRTLARNGLYFVAIWWVLGIVSTVFVNSIMVHVLEFLSAYLGPDAPPMDPDMAGVALDLPLGIAIGLWLFIALVLTVVSAGALRTFVTRDTESIPLEHFTRNLPLMFANLIVGGLVFWIVLTLGFAFLFFPGLFLLVSLFFWNVVVIVEDENFIEGFRTSWELTKGDRMMLFVLGVVVVILAAVIGGIFGFVGGFLPGVAGIAATQIGSAFAAVFGAATSARTYEQLQAKA